MKIRFIGLVLVGSLSMASPAFAADKTATKQDEALTIIRDLKVNANLRNLAHQSIKATVAYKTLVSKMGEDKARDMIDDQLDIIQPKYQDEWDKNLTSAYLEYFTIAELRSVDKQKEFSPYADKMEADRKKVGHSMRMKSQDLLKKMVAEVMTKSLDKTNAKDSKSDNPKS